MFQSLRALLAHAIDYAGVFPPAQLSLADAAGRFNQYQQDRHRWLLGRFVCPAQMLNALGFQFRQQAGHPSVAARSSAADRMRMKIAEQLGVDERKIHANTSFAGDLGMGSLDTVELIVELEEEFDIHIPDDVAENIATFGELVDWLDEQSTNRNISVVATASQTIDEFRTNLPRDIHAIVEFLSRDDCRAAVDSLELKLPADVCGESRDGELTGLFDLLRQQLDRAELSPLNVYIEIPRQEYWKRRVARVLEFIRQDSSRNRLGLKIRMEFPDEPARPTGQQVATFVEACNAAHVPWKATAGLHHPLRSCESSVPKRAFGFLNVFVAGVLASTHQLSAARLLPILGETSISSLKCTDSALQWRDLRATTAEIQRARRDSLISFGSCSFEEPCDGLQALQLIA